MLISTGIELMSNTMKYSSGNSSTLFCEQVSTVTSLFEKWNDCERTVVIYALLKRLRYPSLKFLQNSIDNNINQNVVSQNNMTTSDMNANNPQHLQSLVSAYKSMPGTEMSDIADKETYYVSDIFLKHENKVYSKKEDILSDILEMLPLLTPGNDEAKLIYLSLIPIAVEDTVRQIVSTELVQQIFSYLLIHPAISNEDRRSLSHWLRHLEDHIQSSFASAGQQSLYVLSNNTDACLSNSTTSMSSSIGSLTSRNAWQAIAPPQSSNKNQQQTNTVIADKTEWNVPMPNISDNLCDNFSGIQLNELGSSQNSLGLNYNGAMAGAVGTCPFGSNNQLDNINLNSNNDDHHTSFSKNGTEIPDFELNTCDSCSCTQIGFPSVACDHYNRWSLDESKLSCMKTRRSNSLTTAMTSLTSTKTLATTVNDDFSNSSENLAQYVHKPRSFSLSIENPRVCLLSTGSDTRLDEIKPTYLKFTTHNSGMSNIGQWLKSLRLHKYIDIFKNITYEDMLEITEDYLQNLGVTKGASHKLALCIQKLHDRENNLTKIEQDLIRGQIKTNVVVEELANIVLTPMKPADSTSENVAFKFIRVLDLVSCTIMQMESFCVQDEENISVLLWILERTIHGEAFTTHMNQLKELKFKLSKLKISFTPKTQHQKSGTSNNTNKHRWNCKIRKTDQKNGSNDRINRKNSSDTMNFSFACTQQQQLITSVNRNTSGKGGGGNTAGCPEYKSSSYPNFMKGGNISGQSFHPVKTSVNQQSMYTHPQHFGSSSPHQINHQHHRRSLNNLIVVSPGQGSVATSISNLCLNNSAMPPKSHLATVNDGNGKKQNVHSTRQRNQTIRPLTEIEQTSNSAAKRPIDQSIAAVVLVSKKKNCELGEHNVEMNNNNVNLNRTSKISSICTSTNSCASVLSKNICSAISSNFIINPNSTVLIGNADLKNNAISDITRLEQLEFLCLQMTEQAIN